MYRNAAIPAGLWQSGPDAAWVGMFAKFDSLTRSDVSPTYTFFASTKHACSNLSRSRTAIASPSHRHRIAIASYSIPFRLGLNVLPLLDGYLPFRALTPALGGVARCLSALENAHARHPT